MTKESNIGLIVKNAGIDSIGTAFHTIFTFAAGVVITRTIGAELFGKYSLSNSIFQVLGVFAVFGLNTGVIKLTSKYRAKHDPPSVKGALFSSMALSATFSIALTLLVIAFAPLLAARVFSRVHGLDLVLRIHIIGLPFFGLMTVITAYTQGLKTLKYSVIVEFIARPVVRLVAIVILFLIGLRLFAVLFGTVFSFAAGTLLALYFARKISPFDFKHTATKLVNRELFFYSVPLVFARLMNVIIPRSNTILVGYFRDATSTGLFGAAATLCAFICLGLTSFGKIFAPVISELWEKRDLPELEHTFKAVTKWIVTIGFPIFLLFLLYAPALLSIFGPDFVRAATALKLLSWGQIVNALVGPVGYVLSMTGRQKLNLVNSVILAAVNLVLNVILIRRYGIAGAALGTSIAIVLLNAVRVVQVKVIYGFTPFRLDLYKPGLAGVLSFVAFHFLNRRLLWEDITHTIVLCAAFLVLYFLLLYLFGLKEEKEVLLEILRRRK
jgi:O-antigen/teichoic acid export membrane protein